MNEAGPVRSFLVLLAVGIALGALSGVLWEVLWDAPAGVAFKGTFYLDPPGPDVAFSAAALYVVIGTVVGLAFGVGAALLGRHALRTTAATLLVASLAGAVMFVVGHALGPDDPHAAAESATDYDQIPADLSFTNDAGEPDSMSTALVAWPAGAMAGLAGIYLVLPARDETGVSA